VLDDLGLVPALERVVADLRSRTGLQVDMEVNLPHGQRLPAPIETVSYRVVQEALTNVVRHAGATSVHVVLEMEAAMLRVAVEDDGRGFAVVEQRSQLGLVGIQERAELVDGSVEIISAPGAGTRIELEVPLG
jgi:two-component system sensor histidine kinase UhpB